MKIVLIKPPEPGLQDQLAYPPMGLLYIGAVLDEAGFDVELCVLIDDNWSQVPEGDVYGINMHGPGVFKPVQKLASWLKSNRPDCTIMAGGAFPTCAPTMVQGKTWIDYVVRGEGERTVVELCEKLACDETVDDDIQGIAYVDGDDKVVITAPRPQIEHLDALPLPARELVNPHMIRYRGGVHHSGNLPATTLIVSRGCPFNCAFCDRQTWGRKWRVRSHSSILFEIDSLTKNYGITWYRFVDDNIMANRKWFEGLLDKMIDLYPDIKWTCLARANDVDLPLLEKMKRAGCQEIFFGCESGSQRLLDAMNKKTTVKANIKAIQRCREAGITSCAYMMFGFPGEDDQTVVETMTFLKVARPDKSRISTFLPVPGSDVYANPEKYGVKIKFDPSNFWYFDEHDFCVEYSNITNAEMAELRNSMMKFYGEMGYIGGWTENGSKD